MSEERLIQNDVMLDYSYSDHLILEVFFSWLPVSYHYSFADLGVRKSCVTSSQEFWVEWETWTSVCQRAQRGKSQISIFSLKLVSLPVYASYHQKPFIRTQVNFIRHTIYFPISNIVCISHLMNGNMSRLTLCSGWIGGKGWKIKKSD